MFFTALSLLVIGKVFAFDAGALTGLYRVFAFLGLGLSMLGVGWLYARFVFNAKSEETA